MLGLLDRCAAELSEVEFRTAVRRLLADIVIADAGIFRGRGRADSAAGAIAWIVGKASELFDSHGDGLSIGDLTDWFGLSGSPSQRAGTSPRREPAETTTPSGPGPRDDGDLWEDLDRLDRTVAIELGVDPAPPAPWREPEPVDVLAVGWFPSGAFEEAVRRWPELTARVGRRDYATYARVVQGTLIDIARGHARHPVLVPLDPEDLPPLADAAGLEVTDWRTRAALAVNLAEAGQGSRGRRAATTRAGAAAAASTRSAATRCRSIPPGAPHRPTRPGWLRPTSSTSP